MRMRKQKYIIAGIPIPQKRHRHTSKGFVYDPSFKDKKAIKKALMSQNKAKFLGPVSLFVHFYMKRPQSDYRTGKFKDMLKKDAPLHHAKKPDIDNLCKFIMDCCNDIVFKDDSQVFQLSSSKTYDDSPRTEFTIIGT